MYSVLSIEEWSKDPVTLCGITSNVYHSPTLLAKGSGGGEHSGHARNLSRIPTVHRCKWELRGIKFDGSGRANK